MENLPPAVKPKLEGEHLDFDKEKIQPGDVIVGPNNVSLKFDRKWSDGGTEFSTLDGKFILRVSARGNVKSVEELDQ